MTPDENMTEIAVRRLPNRCTRCDDCYHPVVGPNTDGEPCPWCRDCGCHEADHYPSPERLNRPGQGGNLS